MAEEYNIAEGNDSRERILSAARDRFFAYGFSKVTMDELASDLGMSKKTMYRLFPSKDDLLDKVMAWHTASMQRHIAEIVDSGDDFIAKFVTLWTSMGRMLSRLSEHFRDDIRRCRPDIWRRVEEFRRKVILASFSRMIEEGVQRGLVRKDVHKDVIVLIYLSALQGIITPTVLAQSSFSIDEAFSSIMRVYLDGILTDEARAELHRTLTAHEKGLL